MKSVFSVVLANLQRLKDIAAEFLYAASAYDFFK